MIGEKECKKLDAVSLSNNTVKRPIADMSNDVLQQIVHQVKKSPLYSIQLVESTDITELSQQNSFSALCVLKTKHRNRLDIEANLRLCLIKVKPRFQKLADAISRCSIVIRLIKIVALN